MVLEIINFQVMIGFTVILCDRSDWAEVASQTMLCVRSDWPARGLTGRRCVGFGFGLFLWISVIVHGYGVAESTPDIVHASTYMCNEVTVIDQN